MDITWRTAPAWLALLLGGGVFIDAQQPLGQRTPNADGVQVLPVQGNVYLLAGAGQANAAVQVGKDGALLVDTMTASMADALTAALRSLTAKPVRIIVDTSFHPERTGGNELMQARGATGLTQVPGGLATIIAHENVLNRLTAPVASQRTPPAQKGLPTSEFSTPQKDFYFNGEPIVVYHEPRAHSDGDSIVFFRRSDVIAAGDVFTPDRYPLIDLESGGSVNGLIDALNHILVLTVPEKLQDGGTRVIPGHGRISNEADVVEYRDMVLIVRDRVRDAIAKGQSRAQVRDARLVLDYENRYGPADAFVDAVYTSLGGR
ncbi:MAG: MBL fold metallo-hydrolase [Vicinamibacterales bacterium]